MPQTATIPARPVIGQPNRYGGLNTQYDINDWERDFGSISAGQIQGGGTPFQVGGTPAQQAGGKEGLDFGERLYGQGLNEIGGEAADYASRVKGRLDTDYAKADVYRQGANRRLAQGANKLGMAGSSLGGAQEQNYRQSGMEAGAMNQDYKDKALALYGRNISAKQQGVAGQYMAGKGIGQASEQSTIPNYRSSGTFGCLALVSIGLMSKETHASELSFINLKSYEYIGYTLLISPFIPLILKNGKFAKYFSILAHKYVLNLTGEKKSITGRFIKIVGGSFCSIVGRLC